MGKDMGERLACSLSVSPFSCRHLLNNFSAALVPDVSQANTCPMAAYHLIQSALRKPPLHSFSSSLPKTTQRYENHHVQMFYHYCSFHCEVFSWYHYISSKPKIFILLWYHIKDYFSSNYHYQFVFSKSLMFNDKLLFLWCSTLILTKAKVHSG